MTSIQKNNTIGSSQSERSWQLMDEKPFFNVPKYWKQFQIQEFNEVKLIVAMV